MTSEMHKYGAMQTIERDLVSMFLVHGNDASVDNIFTNAVMNGIDLYCYEASIEREDFPYHVSDIADTLIAMHTNDDAFSPKLESWAKGINHNPIILSSDDGWALAGEARDGQ